MSHVESAQAQVQIKAIILCDLTINRGTSKLHHQIIYLHCVEDFFFKCDLQSSIPIVLIILFIKLRNTVEHDYTLALKVTRFFEIKKKP